MQKYLILMDFSWERSKLLKSARSSKDLEVSTKKYDI